MSTITSWVFKCRRIIIPVQNCYNEYNWILQDIDKNSLLPIKSLPFKWIDITHLTLQKYVQKAAIAKAHKSFNS